MFLVPILCWLTGNPSLSEVNDVIHGRKASEEIMKSVLWNFGVAPRQRKSRESRLAPCRSGEAMRGLTFEGTSRL